MILNVSNLKNIGNLCINYVINQLLGLIMATLNISLPDAMRKWIDEQISSGDYANASEYIRDLIRHDQRQHESLKLALIEAEQRGVSKRKVSDIIDATKNALKNG